MPEVGEEQLAALRCRIAVIDCGIMRLVGERMRVAEEIGRVKEACGMEVVVPAVEEVVVARFREEAGGAGVSMKCAERLAAVLIAAAKEVQGRDNSR